VAACSGEANCDGRQGRDWIATITRIVDHPISLRQALFTSPFRRFIKENYPRIAPQRHHHLGQLHYLTFTQ
jgi:hypothetical protein